MLTNRTNIPLAIAIWLAGGDTYDLVFNPNTVSATSLLKPIRSQVLTRRMLKAAMESVTANQKSPVDIADLIPARLGVAVHTAIEVAWLTTWKDSMTALGYPSGAINRVVLNPPKPVEGMLNIFLERRVERELAGYTISGKFDLVIDGVVEDTKTTRTYNWINGTNNTKYAMQGSIYRWLSPDLITKDYMNVHFVFTDWSPNKAVQDKTYPASRIMTKQLPLMSAAHTQSYVYERLTQLFSLDETPQEYLPRCTPAELWQKPSKWAYYKDPKKIVKATRVFDTQNEALLHLGQEKGIGLIMERPGEPTFCKYCEARYVCTQAKEYVDSGLLFL